VAPSVSGEVIADPGDPIGSVVTLSFETAALRVTGLGEPPQDVPKVQANMIGPKVLDVARFPAITFRSVAVTGRAAAAGAWDIEDPSRRLPERATPGPHRAFEAGIPHPGNRFACRLRLITER
jgi:hypothetical protein